MHRAEWLTGGTRWGVICALLAALLCSSSLSAGLQTEDYIHRNTSRTTHRWVNLWGEGHASAGNYAMQDLGGLPWITAPHYQLQLFRPLSSFTHHLDYRLWPDTPWIMHMQSLLWFGVSVILLSVLYARICASKQVAAIATLFYAVEDAHGMAIGWLANRNALIATVFGLAALILHDRARREKWKVGALLSALAAWTALQAGELALGTFAYAASYAIVIERGPLVQRLRSLVPWIIAGASWAIHYKLSGFGARGSGWYVDPISQPFEFLQVVVERLPLLVAAQVSGLSVETFSAMFQHNRVVLLVFLAAASFVLARFMVARPEARFWALGAVLSAVPVCATLPSDRLLFFVGIGVFPLLAEIVVAAFRGELAMQPVSARAATVVVGAAAFLSHGLDAAANLPERAKGIAFFQNQINILAVGAFKDVRRDQEVVLLTVPDYLTSSLLPTVYAGMGGTSPRHTRALYGGNEVVEVRRPNAQTLVVTAPHGFLAADGNRIFRGRAYPMRPGEGLALTDMTAIVRSVNDSDEPTEVEFRFGAPLEDPRFVWRTWKSYGFVPFTPPPVGGTALVGP